MPARRARAKRPLRARRSSVGGIERITPRSDWPLDFYHQLLTVRWSALWGALAVGYVLFNVVFAGLYLLQPGSVAGARPGSFSDAFFFSVQTMATIGYGEMRPATFYANLLVSVEVLLGMTGLAVASGLVFARFSRPTARVMFSKVAVITTHDGMPSLMFRAANQRRNEILEAQITVMLLRDETSAEGVEMRRFHEMPVSRPHTPMFALTWTVIHPIDKASPLWGLGRDELLRSHAQIVASIVGIDETFSQTVHARHDYQASDIHWNRRFADILSRDDDGHRRIDYRRFHDTVEAPEAPHGGAAPRKVPA